MSEYYKGMTAQQWAEECERLERDHATLERYYRQLYEAAENTWACALPPRVCAPVMDGESGEHRQFVATRSLDALHEAMWPETQDS